jgi:hypothetical protein
MIRATDLGTSLLLFVKKKESRAMKTRYKILLLLVAILIIASSALSQQVGSTSMQFLKVMPCARATALGDAYSVWASGAEAVYWNPAGVALTQNSQFSTTYTKWIFDAQLAALSYAMSLGNFGAMGLQLQYVDYGKFDEATNSSPSIKELPYPGLTGNTFQPYSYLVGLTYAKSLTEKFAMGITFKYAYENLANGSNMTYFDPSGHPYKTDVGTYLFDFGMRYNTGFRTIQVAAAVQNFGPDFAYAVEKEHAPMLFRIGMAADLIGPNSLFYSEENNRLSMAFDLFQPNDDDQQLHMGLEYEYAQTVAFRIGYKYNYDNEGLTFGGGLHYTISGVKLMLDYSYGALGTYLLTNAHRISLGVEL